MFNKKEKMISDLKHQIRDLKAEISAKDNEINNYKSRLKGDRACSTLCKNCQHAIEDKYFSGFMGLATTYSCELDNRCKDFKSKFIKNDQ